MKASKFLISSLCLLTLSFIFAFDNQVYASKQTSASPKGARLKCLSGEVVNQYVEPRTTTIPPVCPYVGPCWGGWTTTSNHLVVNAKTYVPAGFGNPTVHTRVQYDPTSYQAEKVLLVLVSALNHGNQYPYAREVNVSTSLSQMNDPSLPVEVVFPQDYPQQFPSYSIKCEQN